MRAGTGEDVALPTERELRRAADMAPSVLGTRPWAVSMVTASRLELSADWSRSLTALDPRHRELVISCGAALFNVRLAARMAGRTLACSLVPAGQPAGAACPHCGAAGLLAVAETGEGEPIPPRAGERRLHEAIPLRRTFRTPLHPGVPPATVIELELAARSEGVYANRLFKPEVRRLLRVAAKASGDLAASEPCRRELREWAGHGGHVREGYGVAPRDLAARPRHPSRAPVRDLGLTWDQPGEAADYEKYPLLIALAARSDSPAGWLRLGMALQRLLLTATCHGVAASFLTQHLEAADAAGTAASGTAWWPSRKPMQMVVRLGYPGQARMSTPHLAG